MRWPMIWVPLRHQEKPIVAEGLDGDDLRCMRYGSVKQRLPSVYGPPALRVL
jgi:hypothetical protein